MADFVLNALTFGAFSIDLGGNATDDNLEVNIGPNFGGSISIFSRSFDGFQDVATFNLPAGWSLLEFGALPTGTETPQAVNYGFIVFTDLGVPVGTISALLNGFSVGVPCFAQGTWIEIGQGLVVPVETLGIGSMVRTRDHGLQPVRWIGQRHLSSAELREYPNLRAICIEAGALGAGRPNRDLLVSPQHRVLVSSRIVSRMMATSEALIAAKHLVGLDGISVAEHLETIRYYHLLFDRHEIVTSNGCATESLFPGEQALRDLGEGARIELRLLFPNLFGAGRFPAARTFVSGRKGRQLARRHDKNKMALCTAA